MVDVKVKILVDDYVFARDKLENLKDELEKVQDELKEKRKADVHSDSFYNDELIRLNKMRDSIKSEISEFKSKIKKLTDVVYGGLDKQARNNYSKDLDILFSRFLDKEISTVYYTIGENFDERTSDVSEYVVTDNKKQDNKILKTAEYGLKDCETGEIIKKAVVKVSKYVKKGNVGEIING